MSTLGQWFFEKEKASIMAAVQQRAPYVATVATVGTGSDTTLTITDPFTGATELERLSVVGVMPTVGSSVIVVPLIDGTRVAMGMADAGVPEHYHSYGDVTKLASNTTYGGDNTGLTAVGYGLGNLTNVDRATLIGSYLQSGGGTIGDHTVGIGHWLAGIGTQSVLIGNSSSADNQALAIGHSTEAGAQYAVALGFDAHATNSGGNTAVGSNTDATGAAATALGYGAQATASRAIAIGANANATANDLAQIRTKVLDIYPSTFSPDYQTTLRMYLPNGTNRDLYFNQFGDLVSGSTVVVYRGWHPGLVFGTNRKVGGTAAPLKSYPDNAAGGVAMPAGHQMFVYGGFSNAGISWYCCISATYGMGYVQQSLTVAL